MKIIIALFPFGGGIGHMGETCGAVTGVIMVIGLKYGKTRAEDEQIEEKAYSLIQEFVEKFNSRNGSIICRELLGYDISTPEGMKLAKAVFNMYIEEKIWHEENRYCRFCQQYCENSQKFFRKLSGPVSFFHIGNW